VTTPRVSLHMMVRDGASVVGRALRSVQGLVDEVCVVDTGSVDGTVDVVMEVCSEVGISSCQSVVLSPALRPDLFFPDESSSWDRSVPGPFTGTPLLRDWAAARNAGLELCSGEYVLKLDADDVLVHPEQVHKALEYLDECRDVDIVVTPYEVMRRSVPGVVKVQGCDVEYVTSATRLWRRGDHCTFRGVCHENVDRGRRGENWIVINDFYARDMRDAETLRVPHRNYKVLLREHDRPTRKVDDQFLLYLASEAAGVAPAFALEVLGSLGTLGHPTDESWRLGLCGDCLASLGLADFSSWAYEQAALRGNARAALRLAAEHARAGRRGWRGPLVEAIKRTKHLPYPVGASTAEVREAEEMLRRETP
jgi:glycosyltransferase involved in cell wall biosynthesis